MPRQHDRPHLRLPGKVASERYQSFGGGGAKPIIRPNPQQHAAQVATSVSETVKTAREMLDKHPQEEYSRKGVLLSFSMQDANPDGIESLVNKNRNVELAVVNFNDKRVTATVFIPEDQLAKYEEDLLRKIHDYGESEGKKNSNLVSRINASNLSDARDLFTDDIKFFPEKGESIWWEVWSNPEEFQKAFTAAKYLDLAVDSGILSFPDRYIFAVKGTVQQINHLIRNSLAVEELRLAMDTPESFVDMRNSDQEEWVEELYSRVTHQSTDPEVSVLILDGGVNRNHQLISPFLSIADWQSFKSYWTPNDDSTVRGFLGHGTGMAGLALYGDLHDILLSTQPVIIKYKLESMKILSTSDPNFKKMYGPITKQAVESMEVTNPFRKRVVVMALTSKYQTRSGRPSSWSSSIDQLCYGTDDEDYRRLFVLAAGNIKEPIDPKIYIDYTELNREITSEIESPAQAWNALTVGAYTNKNCVPIHLPGHRAYGVKGNLSPTSRTSFAWDPQWPIKPDIVLEGGNLLTDGVITDSHPSVSLLTTNYDTRRAQFTDFGDTSAAAALAARMSAQLYSDVPTRWPETVRGLMVHSAEWTSEMRNTVRSDKKYMSDVLRHYGYGVPEIGRARFSAENDVTLILQERLQPFQMIGQEMHFGDMNFHPLPWSKMDLESLENTMLELRVTLSYFIEPNPSQRGNGLRYKYASHGLGFELKGSKEDQKSFRQRINKIARSEGDYIGRSFKAPEWAIGVRNRQRAGSVSSDWWRGPAVELASCDFLAIYPISGWWRAKPRLPYIERQARYALIISLRTVDPDQKIDLYTPIENLVNIENLVQSEIS